jgi:hypothetical protein
VGAVLTLNLINAYSYYSKRLNWNKVKLILLHDVNLFIIGYIYQLKWHRFPLHNKITDEHTNIDEEINKIIPCKYNDYYLIFDKYEKYFIKLLEDNNIELEYNKNYMDDYKNYIKSYIDKVYQNISIVTIMFHENQNLINHFSSLSSLLNYHKDYCTNGVFNDNNKIFLVDVISVIKQIKNILGIVYLKQW